MEIITSLENKKIKYINKLKNKKFRDEEGIFVIETKHLVGTLDEAPDFSKYWETD